MRVDPDKLDELAAEFKRLSNLIEEQETGLNKEMTQLIHETNAEYSESYVRAETREMEAILSEIRQLAMEVTEELNDKAKVMKKAAGIYREEEEEAAKMLQQDVGFAFTKTLKKLSSSFSVAKKAVADVIEEILDFILGKGRNKYHEPSINLPLDVEPLKANLTVNSKVYNEQVKKLQQRLKDLGYNIKVDGYFGNQTLAAVNAYKNKLGLANQDKYEGVVDSQTWLYLFGGLTGELKHNPKNYSELVRRAQIRLNELGYDIEPTGYFDDKMLKVVNAFKEANQLGNTGNWEGVIGKQTWGVLFGSEDLVVKASSASRIITDISGMNTIFFPDYPRIIRVTPENRGLNYYYDPFGNIIFMGVNANSDKFGGYLYNAKTGLYYPGSGKYHYIDPVWLKPTTPDIIPIPQEKEKSVWKKFVNGETIVIVSGDPRRTVEEGCKKAREELKEALGINKAISSIGTALSTEIVIVSGDSRRTVEEGCKKAREEFIEIFSDPKNQQAFKNTAYAVFNVHSGFVVGYAFDKIVPSSGDPEFDAAMKKVDSITWVSPSKWLDIKDLFDKAKKLF